jgi:soluble lytic murein transglycosylase-like protein
MGHLLLALLAFAGNSALAQVYTGTSSSGSIVLSGNFDEVAHVLLIEAEKLPPPVALVAPRPSEASAEIPSGYLPFIVEASHAYGIPTELIHAVISVESNYNPSAVSTKGARGLMQLMPATAKRFGARNSLDPRQNILGGSQYLRWLLDYFNADLELTLAAYNAGEGAVVQAGRKIPKFVETERYVPKVMRIYSRALRGV